MSIEFMMPSSHLILCCPFLLPPSVFPSIRVFSSESALPIRWYKYWGSSFSISPSNEYPGLISFRIDWFDLLAVQGTPKSLLQHHSLKVSIWHSAYFMAQLSHPYMITGGICRTYFKFQAGILLFPLSQQLHKAGDNKAWSFVCTMRLFLREIIVPWISMGLAKTLVNLHCLSVYPLLTCMGLRSELQCDGLPCLILFHV